MRTGNPALNKNTFKNFTGTYKNHMTINGTVNKTFMMLFLLTMSAFFSWTSLSFIGMEFLQLPLIGLSILGFIIVIITVFKKEWSPVTAPIYSIVEGALLGIISAYFEYLFPGIVLQAISLTLGTLFLLLTAYKSGIIKATENFKLGIFAATGAIALVYIVSMVLGFFGTTIPYIHDAGPIGIIFSLIVVVIAALNLVLDFDFIEQGAHNKAPKYMEWYASFGLMVTLVWLYLEILRLLAKMRSRD
jgi:uncharacterized YccA/Bax inhibitor family protein